MTPKELQQKYLNNLAPKADKQIEKVAIVPSQHYINHVKSQAETITRLLGKDQGDYYIKDAFRNFYNTNEHV